MSSESDSDVFFDAEDVTPVKTAKVPNKEEKTSPSEKDALQDEASISDVISVPVIKVKEEDLKEVVRKAKDNEQRRRKVEELRRAMLSEEEEPPEEDERSSLASSSVEGPFYPRGGHQESGSVMSLGRVGSILGDRASLDSRLSSTGGESLHDVQGATKSKGSEPDVVASTKGEQVQRPVAPPRKKKRNKNPNPSSLKDQELPSPSDPVESLARELEYSLDLHSATRGQYVVKPQDREQDRAEGPGSGENSSSSSERTERSEGPESARRQEAGSGGGSLHRHEKLLPDDVRQPPGVRTRSDSGRPLTDQEILAQVSVRNLDTGEQIPLSLAEEHLPKCLNPLSLHIMRLTSEYVSTTALDKESDEEGSDARKTDSSDMGARAWFKTRDFGKKLKMEVSKIRTVVVDKVTHSRHAEEENSEEEALSELRPSLKIKVSGKLKSAEKGGGAEFENIRVLQELAGEHTGAIWTMKFSSCGRLLATAGQDHDLRIWVLRDAFEYFNDMRQKFNKEGKASPIPCQPDVCLDNEDVAEDSEDNRGPFVSKPFCRYKGHTAELLDVSWSKNYFILSSSMDKTVRLWHISRKECLCCFQHIDFVTAIAFHPRDDRYFLSGSLDGKLRLWNIPDKKVTLWNELDGPTRLITAVGFCQGGKVAIVGTYDGRCILYYTDQLKYYTQIFVRSTKGKNAQGRKISGIESMPGEDKILVTSNDSRIRLYDFRDLCLTCKYKGYVNLSSQIKASFSHDGKYIISGSENQFIYIWKTSHDCAKFRRDRNDYWTGIKAHNAVVTSAVFAPDPSRILRQLERDQEEVMADHKCYVMVSADYNGNIKVFLHKPKAAS